MQLTAKAIAERLAGRLVGDGSTIVTGVASLDSARPGSLVYVDSPKHLAKAEASAAACLLLGESVSAKGKTAIQVRHPKRAFAKAVSWFVPPPKFPAGVHPSAIVSAEAKIEADVSIGPLAVIERGARIGRGTRIGAACYVGDDVRIGEECVLHANVTLYARVGLGSRVVVHSGTVIGSDGFGYVLDEGRYWKFPQIGDVVIGDDVEIGSNVSIDRGALDSTIIGRGTKIDNLVQVGHNVRIGEDCVIAAQTGISGSCVIGNRVVIGGQVGFGEQVRVEDEAVLGGQAGLLPGKRIRRGQTVWGTPARPLAEFKRLYAHFGRLDEMAAALAEIKKQLEGKGLS